MAAPNLEQVISDHLTAGLLRLPAEALGSPDTTALFQEFFADGTLVMTDADTIQGSPAHVVVIGKMTIFGLTDAVATADFYVAAGEAAGEAEVTITINVPADWTFGVSFPSLESTVLNDFQFFQAGYILESQGAAVGGDGELLVPGTIGPALIAGNGAQPASLPPGLSFTGALKETGPLEQLDWLIGDSPLRLSGQIVLTDNVPKMTLKAPVIGESTLGFLSLEIAVVLRSEAVIQTPAGADDAVTAQASASLDSVVSLGAGTNQISLPVLMFLPSGPPQLLTFQADTKEVSLAAIQQLSAVMNDLPVASLIPSALPLGDKLALSSLTFIVSPKAASNKKLASVGAMIDLTSSWTIIDKVLSLEQLTIEFLLTDPTSPSLSNLSATVAGVFEVGVVPLAVTVVLPELSITAGLPEGYTLDLVDLLEHYYPSALGGTDVNLGIDALSMTVNPSSSGTSFDLAASIYNDWELDVGFTTFTLKNLAIGLQYALGETTGSIEGTVAIGGVDFVGSASHPEADGGWNFFFGLAPNESIDLIELLPEGLRPPPDNLDMKVTELSAEFETSETTNYTLRGGTTWTLVIGDFTFNIDAGVVLKSSKKKGEDSSEFSGSVTGALSINNVKLSATYEFEPDNQTIILKFEELTVTVNFGDNRDTILQVNLGDMTLGGILEKILRIANPSFELDLPTPWNLLLSINLKSLTFVVNLTKNTVGISYKLSADFGFLKISAIGVTYDSEKQTVDISIEGNFLGKQYGGDDPLKWDALNEQPPAVPGAGSAVFELDYLGVGQHVRLADTSELHRVGDVIEALQKTVQPVDNPKENPLTQSTGLVFDSEVGWLLGTRFVVIETVDLSVIFNDPVLYGLAISLSGPRAQNFAGLSFEILYKRITDNIGVYSILLKVPTVFRQLQFGAVSVTLPVIGVDIYTNGNFRIDFGFPKNNDFSVSFALEVFPFVGAGGFYFALLDGATSKNVPAVTTGTFSPVIEVGFGLEVGVGKNINKGVLEAGLSLTVQGILEGTLAWFNPQDQSIDDAMYYAIEGSVAIVGKLYGKVDFKVISVSISVTVFAGVKLSVVAYEPILIALRVSVEVKASVKIVFIRIHFKFTAQIDAAFTIGHKQHAPWDSQLPGPRALRQMLPHTAETAPLFAALSASASMSERMSAARALFVEPETLTLDWQPFRYFDHQPLPMFAVSSVTQGTPDEGGDDPVPKVVVLLFIPNTMPADARTIDEAMQSAPGVTSAAFNDLGQGMLAWTLHAWWLGRGGSDDDFSQSNIGIQDLQAIFGQLSGANPAWFDEPQFEEFFSENFKFEIGTGGTDGANGDDDVSATIFPMFPGLNMTVDVASDPPASITRDFSTWLTPLPPDYQDVITEYFRDLEVQFQTEAERQDEAARNGQAEPAAEVTFGGEEPSVASLMFQDYFQMLVRQLLQAAEETLSEYAYQMGANDKLDAIVDAFYVIVDEEERLKVIGDVAAANQDSPGILDPDATFELNGYACQVRSGDTLADISSRLQATNVTAATLGTDNQNSTTLLNPGGTITIPSLTYTVPPETTLAGVANQFSVPAANVSVIRGSASEAGVVSALSELYVINDTLRVTDAAPNTLMQIAQANDVPVDAVTGLNPQFSAEGVLPPGTTVDLPTIQLTTAAAITAADLATQLKVAESTVRAMNPDPNKVPPGIEPIPAGTPLWLPAVTVTVLPNTTASLQSYFGVQLNQPDQTFAPGTEIPLNNVPHTIQPGDSLASIALYYFVLLDTLIGDVESNSALLAPLAKLEVPTLKRKIGPDQTLTQLASTYGITVQELAVQTCNQVILLDRQTLTLPDVTQTTIGNLLQSVPLAQYNSAGSVLSRFLLHGLRLPNPKDLNRLSPFYYLTGQQFAAPEDPFTVELGNPDKIPWIEFDSSGDTTANGDAAPKLPVPVTEDVSKYRYPGLQLELNAQPPQPLQIYQRTPRQFNLRNRIDWQVADFSSHTQNGGLGSPTVWPLPEPLLRRLAASGGTPQFVTLALGTHQPGNRELTVTPVNNYWWATVVDVRLQPIIPEHSSTPLKNSYLLAGTSEDGRMLLEELLAAPPSEGLGSLVAYLAYPTSESGADDPAGLSSDNLDGNGTQLFQTNLSTVSHNNNALARIAPPAAAGPPCPAPSLTGYAAPMTDLAQFTKLLWEGSVVNSGGYYLRYEVKDADAELPGYLFGQNGTGTIKLLLRSKHVGGRLQEFFNYVVVGDQISNPNSVLFVEGDTIHVGDAQGKSGPTQSIDQVVQAINQKFAVALKQTYSASNLVDANSRAVGVLQVGAKIQINADGATATVLAGDSFASIALANGASLSDLALWNGPRTGLLLLDALLGLSPDMVAKSAIIPAGNSGFVIERTDPEPEDPKAPQPPEVQLQVLYNLLSFSVTGTGCFNASREGLAVGPTEPDQRIAPNRKQARLESSGQATWIYEQVLPIASFVDQSQPNCSNVASGSMPAVYPSQADDPYAAVGRQPAIAFAFQDIYGNRTKPADPVGSLSGPADEQGYYDKVLALVEWPSTKPVYDVSPGADAGSAFLNLAIYQDVTRYTPGPGQDLGAAQRQALADRSKYGVLYYQLRQDDVTVAVTTTLHRSTLPITDKTPFIDFAGNIYNYLGVVQRLQPVLREVGSDDSFGKLGQAYHLTATALGAANQESTHPFEPRTINFPYYTLVQTGQTLQSLADRAGSLSGEDFVAKFGTPAELVVANAEAEYLLQLGAAMLSGEQRQTYDGRMLQVLAQGAGVPVTDIGVANQTVPLNPQADWPPEIKNLIENAGANTLQLLAAALQMTVPDLTVEVQTVTEIFRTNADIVIPFVYRVRANDTFQTIADATGASLETLATLNADNDVLLQAGGRPMLAIFTNPVLDEESLRTIADAFTVAHGINVTVGDIVQVNADTLLSPRISIPGKNVQGKIILPYSVEIDDSADGNAAVYQTVVGDTLGGIAEKHATSVSGLALANAYDLDMLQPGGPILVPVPGQVESSATDPAHSETIAQVAARGGGTASEVGELNAHAVSLLRPGARITVPGGTQIVDQLDTLASIASQHAGTTARQLAELNATTGNLLVIGAGVVVPVHTTIRPNDTLASVAQQFPGVTVSALGLANVDAEAKADNTGTLKVGGRLLVPPGPVRQPLPIDGAPYPSHLFELKVEFSIFRGGAIDKQFLDVPGVQASRTAVDARTQPVPDSDDANIQSLDQFAAAFEQALPGLKLATGQTKQRRNPQPSALMRLAEGENGETDAKDSKTLWAVWLKNETVTSPVAPTSGAAPSPITYSIQTQAPQFFSVPPLSTAPVSGDDVLVPIYKPGKGFVGSKDVHIKNIDLDVWASQFLALTDQFLAAANVVPAFNINAEATQAIIGYKELLACQISQRVTTVFASNNGAAAEGNLDDAIEALRQQLLIELANVYKTDAIVQYPVTVNSPYAESQPNAPRISGKPQGKLAEVRPDRNDTDQRPSVSLGTAKVPLNCTQDSFTPHLTFLFGAANPASQTAVDLRLSYKVNELEFDIGQVPGIDDYQSSSWLSFVLPLASEQSWTASIPVPLRSYPTPPTLLRQTPTYHVGPRDSITDAMCWDFSFEFKALEAAQDQLQTSVLYNVPGKQTAARALAAKRVEELPDPDNLFEALARFIEVAPQLSADLEQLPDKPLAELSPDERDVLDQAIVSFAKLARWVAQTWSNPTPAKFVVTGPMVREQRLAIKRKPLGTDSHALELTPVGRDTTDGRLPRIDLPHATLTGTSDLPNGGQRLEFTGARGASAGKGEPPVVHYDDLPTLMHQNAWGGVELSRNAKLIEGETTNPAFVYRTPMVRFSNVLTPLAVDHTPFSIADLAPAGSSITQFLSALFGELTAQADRNLPFAMRVACGYGYLLTQSNNNAVPAADPIAASLATPDAEKTGRGLIATLPVTLAPNFNFPKDSTDQLAASLDTSISAWYATNRPATTGGVYVFDVSFFLGVNPAEVPQTTPPLIQFTDLRLPLVAIGGSSRNGAQAAASD